MKVTAIICAAGKGERAGFNKNKLLMPLHGAPVLWRTLKKFDTPEIDEVIITSSQCDREEISALAAPFGFKVVSGGATRTESVKNALAAATGDAVLIHDGARPFVSQQLITSCINCVKAHGSAVCAVTPADTVIYGEEQARLDRNKIYLVQTPQGFLTREIRRAYLLAGDAVYTDDSAVYAEFIAPPVIIDGEPQNKKLTYKSDFDVPPLPFYGAGRVGFGVDTHAFGEGSGVTLGGVSIPCDRSLIAHSDGDVLVHAIMDALLSAAGLKDIGHYFPDTDVRFKGASSLIMLAQTLRIIKNAGYAPVNVSASVQAEKPKLKNSIGAIRQSLSHALSIPETAVAVAAGTCEGLGFVGEGLGITAYAAVTVKEV